MKKLLYLCLVLSLVSCNQFENPEIPAYIQINSSVVNTDYGIEGTANHDIKSVHIYVDGQSIGYYDLPSMIPILKSGEHKIDILPGIYENGISETGTLYPFFTTDTRTINLVQDSIITIQPSYEYFNSCVFWNEDFEDPAIKFDVDPSIGYGWELTSNPEEVYERDYSTKVTLDDNNTRFRMISDKIFGLPTGGAEVFLEIHYKNENSALIGIVAGNSGGENTYPIVILNSQGDTPNWKKMYINLKNYVSDEPNATYFKLFIDGIQDSTGTSTDLYFDNIKVVHT